MEEEGGEQEIQMVNEPIIYSSTGGAVSSVNGYTGDVVLTTSDLENTSDYQTGSEVESSIATAIAGKQDTLTAGTNITIVDNVISATGGGATYTAGNGLNLTGTEFSVDTNIIATKQSVDDEIVARQNADNGLQGQIDALAASSDVTDIVGTKAELNAYDTSTLKDNDIIKVLQDESQNDETTYYRWSTTTQTFTLIGEEGPYYTKSAVDTLLNAKQNTLTAGTNIQINNDTISATDTTYTAGAGLSLTGTEFSVDTTTIATQSDLAGKQNTLTAGSNIQISGDTISATDTTYSNFTGTDGTSAGAAGLVPAPATTDAGKFLKADGTWAEAGGGSSVNVVQTTGTSTTDVMSQDAATKMVYKSEKIRIGNITNLGGAGGVVIGDASATDNRANLVTAVGDSTTTEATGTIAIGHNAHAADSWSSFRAVALGQYSYAKKTGSVAIGAYAETNSIGEVNIGSSQTSAGYLGSSNYRLLTGVYDGQSDHDAANVGQLNARVIGSLTSAPTTSTAGVVGALVATVESGTGHLYICTDNTGGTYTWQQLV